MMVARRLIATVLVLVTGIAGAARGAAGDTASGIPNGASVSETVVPFVGSGAITVHFRGSTAAGCAARGLCAYRGTVSWSAAPGGQIVLLRARTNGHTSEVAEAQPGLDTSTALPLTSAEVDRVLPGGHLARCTDSVTPDSSLGVTIVRSDTALRLRLFSPAGSLLATECAGPTDGALAGVASGHVIAIAAIRRGQRIGLTLRRRFSAAGLSGTIDSSVVLQFRHPRTTNLSGGGSGGYAIKPVRAREASEPLRLIGFGGEITAAVTGDADPLVCSLLDACGATGRIVLAPTPRRPNGSLEVVASTKVPPAALLAALGAGPGSTDRVSAFGELAWSDAGRARLSEAQDGRACAGAIPLRNGSVELVAEHGRLVGSYAPGSSPRGECPGPQLQDVAFAEGSVPLSALRQPSFVLRLRAPGPSLVDGYRIRFRGALTLRIRRGSVSQQVISES